MDNAYRQRQDIRAQGENPLLEYYNNNDNPVLATLGINVPALKNYACKMYVTQQILCPKVP